MHIDATLPFDFSVPKSTEVMHSILQNVLQPHEIPIACPISTSTSPIMMHSYAGIRLHNEMKTVLEMTSSWLQRGAMKLVLGGGGGGETNYLRDNDNLSRFFWKSKTVIPRYENLFCMPLLFLFSGLRYIRWNTMILQTSYWLIISELPRIRPFWLTFLSPIPFKINHLQSIDEILQSNLYPSYWHRMLHSFQQETQI